MAGEIGVESHAGQGTTFSFSLPLIAADPVQQNRPPESSELAGLKLLIVEDNATNRTSCRIMGLSWGMSVMR